MITRLRDIQASYSQVACTCEFHLVKSVSSLTFLGLLGVIVYDFLLTIADEVRLVKRRPINLATVLYLVIRYGVIINSILQLEGGVIIDGVLQLESGAIVESVVVVGGNG